MMLRMAVGGSLAEMALVRALVLDSRSWVFIAIVRGSVDKLTSQKVDRLENAFATVTGSRGRWYGLRLEWSSEDRKWVRTGG